MNKTRQRTRTHKARKAKNRQAHEAALTGATPHRAVQKWLGKPPVMQALGRWPPAHRMVRYFAPMLWARPS